MLVAELHKIKQLRCKSLREKLNIVIINRLSREIYLVFFYGKKGKISMKATRHNGRSGKHGTYDAKHNDRRFDVENSEHIDAERTKMNV